MALPLWRMEMAMAVIEEEDVGEGQPSEDQGL